MNPATRSRLDRLRPRTLRAKLTWGLVVLLALSCATVGLTSVFALRSYLTGQLDHQLADSGCLFPSTLRQLPEQPTVADNGQEHTMVDRSADTRGQAIGTFG